MVELRRNLREAREEAAVGKETLSQQFEDTVSALQQQLGERTDEVREMKSKRGKEGRDMLVGRRQGLLLLSTQLSVMQGELKTVKEFRKKRAEMQAQLAQLQGALSEAEREHQAALQALEQRFFEEKVCMCVCV